MAEETLDEWRVKVNDIMSVTLVTKTEQGPPKTIASFHPTWTYPIVDGPDTIREHSETIYGYKGLKISLRFNASDMRPHFSHTSSKLVPDSVAIEEPPEINELFEPFLPPGKTPRLLRATFQRLTNRSCLWQEGRLRFRCAEHSRRLAPTRRTD